MHHQGERTAKKRGDRGKRWKWAVSLVDFGMLRCGKSIGIACTGFFEAVVAEVINLTAVQLPFVRWFLNDLLLFHILEEMEHSELTVQLLGEKSSVLMRIATFPLVTMVFGLFFLGPPPVLLLCSPTLLLYPETYADLVQYYAAFLPGMAYALWLMVTRWLLLLPENPGHVEKRYAALKGKVTARGIEFDIKDQETYTLLR